MEKKWVAYFGERVEYVEVLGNKRGDYDYDDGSNSRCYVRFASGAIDEIESDDRLRDTEREALEDAIKYTENWTKRYLEDAGRMEIKNKALRERLAAL